MLYALGVGLGADPMNEVELPFVYENGLKAVPSLATVVAWGAGPGIGKMGINFLMVVHGEQAVEFHQPMPTSASLTADSRVVAAYDKGPKGAVIVTETVLKDAGIGRKDRHPHIFHLRARRRRLWRTLRGSARATPDSRPRAGPVARLHHPSGPGPALSVVRRPQSPALRP